MTTKDNIKIVAIVDAAILFGASRCYRNVHDDPSWQFKEKYNRIDDRILFNELMHYMVLYDKILLDSSSLSSSISFEIDLLMSKVNGLTDQNLISKKNIAFDINLHAVIVATCRLISKIIINGNKSLEKLHSLDIPWAYNKNHQDYNQFQSIFRELSLDESLIPIAIYAYRAIIYAGFAKHYSMYNDVSAIYLAAPGRINVLSMLLNTNDLEKLEFPRIAFRDLLSLLELPENAFDFSNFESFGGSEISKLSVELKNLKPSDALRYVVKLRKKTNSKELRNKWAEKLSNFSNISMMGNSYNQNMENVSVSGNLYQIIRINKS